MVYRQRFGGNGHRHGLSNTSEYTVWSNMLRRCYGFKNHPRSAYWGDEGIQVCERWQKSFLHFLEDIGQRPSPQHTIDRYPNPYGDYESGNVRWATRKEQANNRRARSSVLKQKTLFQYLPTIKRFVYHE